MILVGALFIPILAVVFALLVGGLVLKRKILSVVPADLRFHETSPSSFPVADLNALARYTDAFERLGFVNVGDYGLTAGDASVQPGFARLLVHPDDGRYAEVNQLFPAGRPPTEVRAVLMTAFDDGWTLSTTDRTADATTYAMRRPRALWTSEPGVSPETLVHRHEEVRARLEHERGLRPQRRTSREAYFARQREEAAARKELVRRRNIYGFIGEIVLRGNRVPSAWLGTEPGPSGPSRAR